MGTATSVDEAIAIEQEGIDIVIAQGSEAGGHRSSFYHNSRATINDWYNGTCTTNR